MNKDIKYITFSSQETLYEWFLSNYKQIKKVWLEVSKQKPGIDKEHVSYIETVEVLLCFGWVDSTFHNLDGHFVIRCFPRKKNSNWTELNKERCRRLIKVGLMREEGLQIAPDLNKPFIPNKEILKDVKKDKEAYEFFLTTPELYQRIRLSNLEQTRNRDENSYQKALANFIKKCKQKSLYGEWNDGGRLLNY